MSHMQHDPLLDEEELELEDEELELDDEELEDELLEVASHLPAKIIAEIRHPGEGTPFTGAQIGLPEDWHANLYPLQQVGMLSMQVGGHIPLLEELLEDEEELEELDVLPPELDEEEELEDELEDESLQ